MEKRGNDKKKKAIESEVTNEVKKKIIEYYIFKVEYYSWLTNYIYGCMLTILNPKENKYEGHEDSGLAAILEKCINEEPQTTNGKLVLLTPIAHFGHLKRAFYQRGKQIKQNKQISRDLLTNKYTSVEKKIADINIKARGAAIKLIAYCLEIQEIYSSLCEMSQKDMKKNLSEEIEKIIKADCLGNILTNKAFDYIGHHRELMGRKKIASYAGSKPSKKTIEAKALVRSYVEEKCKFVVNKEDLDEMCKRAKRKERTITNWLDELEREKGITIEGDWKKFRKQKHKTNVGKNP